MPQYFNNQIQPTRKELGVKLEPNITTWLTHSQPLCAILSNSDVYPWFFQNFIHITSYNHFPGYLRLDLEYPGSNEADLSNARRIATNVVWLPHYTLLGDKEDLLEIAG